ncbi:hypothetical protein PanWU01x14_054340 [Parasponia andersonii]|uniref:Uncharacterized protein n=1 Tax=Parasponia andersonii TaxID=3476 RepID=A0A2P5DKQ8_PARAD|nr:hypothetical protein PanWU01x14_054340 [Parasponia andersonii]
MSFWLSRTVRCNSAILAACKLACSARVVASGVGAPINISRIPTRSPRSSISALIPTCHRV